jgi:type IV pilus assembly protein PilA
MRERAMRNRRNGFTLVELMIVVAIIGVLASLAIYGVARYLKHAKTAEATRSLGAIENGARQQYQRETPWGDADSQQWVHTFCPSDGPTPATPPMASKAPFVVGQWNTPGWTCLKFFMAGPTFYSYAYTSNSGTGTDAKYAAEAFGDLDGNGVNSTFRVSGIGGQQGDAIRASMLAINEDE